MTTQPSRTIPAPAHSEMIEMATDKCRRLLRSHSIGRVAFRDEHGLALFPVNYASDGQHVAVRCDSGGRLTKATQSEVVFEIDEFSQETHTGWSVVVSGVAYEINDAHDHDSELTRMLQVEPWAPGRKGTWIRIEPQTVTGRMVRPA